MYLLPGSVIGAAFIVFSIINFDFERLNSRRIWTSACGAILAIVAGAFASIAVFGPLYVVGLVDIVIVWLEESNGGPATLLVGGALYGIPVGIILGFVIGVAIVSTERWSRKPVLA